MLEITKETALANAVFPFGVVEVTYPRELREEDFRKLVAEELRELSERFQNYDRKAVFGEYPYFRFFRKFKKTYPVMLQLESVLLKGRPFPNFNPVAEVPFLLELTTQVLSGAHDLDRIRGAVSLYLAAEKEPFLGLRGEWMHTYPGDFCARDEEGIIFSLIAGADDRTCARTDTRRVLYPVFGTPDLPETVISSAMETLCGYIRVLAPDAEISCRVI